MVKVGVLVTRSQPRQEQNTRRGARDRGVGRIGLHTRTEKTCRTQKQRRSSAHYTPSRGYYSWCVLSSKQVWTTNNICTISERFSLLECRGLDGAMTPDGWMDLDSIKDMMDAPKHAERQRETLFVWVSFCCAGDVPSIRANRAHDSFGTSALPLVDCYRLQTKVLAAE